jgi:hypothetical protein
MCHWEGTGKPGGTHQLLVYADDVNLLGDNIHTIKKKKELGWSRSKHRENWVCAAASS